MRSQSRQSLRSIHAIVRIFEYLFGSIKYINEIYLPIKDYEKMRKETLNLILFKVLRKDKILGICRKFLILSAELLQFTKINLFLGTGSEEREELPLDTLNDADNSNDMQRQYSLNDFELIRVIGRGSYAKVLMVELKRTKRIYAMKVIKKALVTDDEDIDWVQTEKHVFETASNHPFLVGLHSCFQTPSRLFFVIEFVRGGDLMFHMQRQRRLPEEHARFYAAEISLALNFLHEKGTKSFLHCIQKI